MCQWRMHGHSNTACSCAAPQPPPCITNHWARSGSVAMSKHLHWPISHSKWNHLSQMCSHVHQQKEELLLEYNTPSAMWESFVTTGNQSFDRQIQSYHKWRQGHIFASLWIPRRHPAGTRLPEVWSAVWWLGGHAAAQWTQQWQHHSRLGQAGKIRAFIRYLLAGDSAQFLSSTSLLRSWFYFEGEDFNSKSNIHSLWWSYVSMTCSIFSTLATSKQAFLFN